MEQFLDLLIEYAVRWSLLASVVCMIGGIAWLYRIYRYTYEVPEVWIAFGLFLIGSASTISIVF